MCDSLSFSVSKVKGCVITDFNFYSQYVLLIWLTRNNLHKFFFNIRFVFIDSRENNLTLITYNKILQMGSLSYDIN